LVINLKVHSAFQKYFDQEMYKIDAFNAESINDYLRAVHPKFANYISQIENGESQESYSLVDSNFKLIENDAFGIKKFKEGETVYIAPLVVGGGGKRGTLLLLAVFAVFAAPAIAGALTAPAAGTGSLTAAQASPFLGGSAASGGFLGGLGKAFAAMPSFAKSIVGNLAMGVVSSIFTKKPKASQQTESTTRENGMFGSLTNTSTSGTPVPLHYGQVRVAGQFLSGYINSEEHGKNDIINVGDQFS
jgi:predicted phage tail protein